MDAGQAGQLHVDLCALRNDLEYVRSYVGIIAIGVLVIAVATVASVWHHW
jgi:hypothetical protein